MSTTEGIGRKAASGAAYIGLSQIAKIFLLGCSTIVVSRLVKPGDFGVIAMASPVMAFLLIFQDLGLNQAVVQHETISDAQLNAMFWINMAGSALAALALLAVSPAIGLFYGDPRAGYITAAFSANVLLGGTMLQHGALLNRRLHFAGLGAIDVATAAAGFVATAACAYFMRNYWALWLGSFISIAVNAVLLWSFVDWRPRLRIEFENTRALVGFGANVTAFNIVNFLIRNLDNVLIARVWGAYQLGLYDRSYKLMMFPLQNVNTPLARVMIPVLSRLQGEPERYRRVFLMAVRSLLMLTTPAIAVAASMSDRLVPFLLGNQWKAASPIFFWLSLAAFPQVLSNASGWLFISYGKTRSLMHWGWVGGTITVSAFLAGLHWGASGVACAYAIAVTLVMSPILYVWAPRGTPVTTADLYGVLIQPLAAAAAAWAVIALMSSHVSTALLFVLGLFLSYGFAVIAQAASASGRQALRYAGGMIMRRL